MKQIILALILAVAGIGAAVAANPIREGNMISGHVLVKGSEENIPYATVLIVVWGIERSGFFNGREKWAKGFENQRV